MTISNDSQVRALTRQRVFVNAYKINLTAPAMLTASELSRKANVPIGRLLRAIRAGLVQPDLTAMDSRLFLFQPHRVPDIQNRLNTIEAAACDSDAIATP